MRLKTADVTKEIDDSSRIKSNDRQCTVQDPFIYKGLDRALKL